ncbi:MAG TPA: hypothetical protein VNU71_13735 [Burkholderiaceae bacterium]|nr:hypothetical protein [Burkholderiaceae bacterium]
MNDFADPAQTLRLLNELEGLGFADEAFATLHHFTKPERIANHRRYCEALVDEQATFQTSTNKLVQRRLVMVLAMYRAGQFASNDPGVFVCLAQAALLEVPHDRRPLAEQVK